MTLDVSGRPDDLPALIRRRVASPSRPLRANSSRRRASSSCWRLISSSQSLPVGRALSCHTRLMVDSRNKYKYKIVSLVPSYRRTC